MKHYEMVQHLRSPHYDTECINQDIVHGAIGLSTEAAELLEAIEKDDEVNIVEECGDACWYAQLILEIYGIHIEPDHYGGTSMEGRLKDASSIVRMSGDVLDVVKRAFFYGKGAEGINHEAIKNGARDIVEFVSYILASCGVSVDECLDKNYRKLMKKRYPNGFEESEAWNRDTNAERNELES